jgi:hypothetical protein
MTTRDGAQEAEMSTETNGGAGIRATEELQAKNVVAGVQIQGGTGEDSAVLVALAKDIRAGGVDARRIVAENVVSGLQFIKDPDRATVADLEKGLATLAERLDEAIAAGEFAGDAADREDAVSALEGARTELGRERPSGSRILRRLGELTDIVTAVADRAEQAGTAVSKLAGLAPMAATIWQVAQRLLGG